MTKRKKPLPPVPLAGKSKTPVPVMWKNGFTIGLAGSVRKFAYGIGKPTRVRTDGGRLPWKVDEMELSPDLRVEKVFKSYRFKTKAEAKACCERLVEVEAKKRRASVTFKKLDGRDREKERLRDRDKVRLTVLSKYYPGTIRAQGSLPPIALRSLSVDLVRLHKPGIPAKGEFKQCEMDREMIEATAKAYKEKSPFDPVDYEIAANWYAEGYSNETRNVYTVRINAKLGTKLTPKAMQQRRLKLNLMSDKESGPSPK